MNARISIVLGNLARKSQGIEMMDEEVRTDRMRGNPECIEGFVQNLASNRNEARLMQNLLNANFGFKQKRSQQ